MTNKKNRKHARKKKVKKEPSPIDYFHEIFRNDGTVCTFFKGTKFQRFFSETYGFPSYKSVEGTKPIPLPNKISFDERTTFPVHNPNDRDLSDAVRECEKLGRRIFTKSKRDKLVVTTRDYMITGSTLPIRISYKVVEHVKGKPSKTRTEKIYVKKMDLSRIFMSALYSMITGREVGTLFSESSVIIPEIKGKLVAEYKPEEILQNPKLREELVRLSVDAYFLGLSDVDNDYNIIVSPNKKKLIIIDFDKVYENIYPDPSHNIINPFVTMNYRYDPDEQITVRELEPYPDKKLRAFFSENEIKKAAKQEKERIYSNLRRNFEEFSDLIKVMSRFNYYNLSVKNLFGEKDVVSYYSGMHHLMRGTYTGTFKKPKS